MPFSPVDTFVGRLAWSALPVYRVIRADPAPSELRDATSAGRPAFPWARWPGGALVAEDFNRPSGPRVRRTYDPLVELSPLLAHATRVKPDDDRDLLAFVNRWGLLGLAEPRNGAHQYWDSVFMTRVELQTLQRLAAWLGAMKQRRWQEPSLPSRAELQTIMQRRLPATLTPGEIRTWTRCAFAMELNRRLQRVGICAAVRVGGKDLEHVLQPQCLVDVLYLALCQHAGADDTVPRKCHGCGGVFFVSVTNTKRRHCGARCKNTAKIRRWRRRRARSSGAARHRPPVTRSHRGDDR